jgi:hypothetical protein
MDRMSLIIINLANNNLGEIFLEEAMFVNQLMLDRLKFSQVKDHGEIVIGNENSKSFNGALNSKF